MPLEFISRSEKQTAALASKVARLIIPGETVFLKGQLGAGKTFFIRAAARELGVVEPVTSPSFTLAQTYSGKIRVHHLDLYRLLPFQAGDLADFEPYFEADAVTFVEWPEQAEPFLENPDFVIEIEHMGNRSRKLRISCGKPGTEQEMERMIAETGA